jgi:hypothetical protein
VSNRYANRYTNTRNGNDYIGDDLTEKDLDILYDVCILGEPIGMTGDPHGVVSAWHDKPHRILHRLLMRLTRAEEEMKELMDSGDCG